MKTIILAAIFLIFVSRTQAQDGIALKIDAQPVNLKNSKLVLMMLEYNDDTIIYNDRKQAVVPPKSLSGREKAFGFLSFQGNANKDGFSQTLVLLEGYKGYFSKLYVDKNFNFDLTDDGGPYILKDSLSSVSVTLSNSEIPQATLETELQYIRYPSSKHRDMAESMKADDLPALRGNKFIDHDFWLTETVNIHLTFDALLGEDSVKLGLVDYNLNGLFNDIGEDKILVGSYKEGTIFDRPGKGSYVVGDATFLEIENKYYQLLEVGPTGKLIRLRPASQQSYDYHNKGILSKGSVVPDIKFLTFEGLETSIHKELKPDKFTLIDIWGTWCKGCLVQTDKLKQLDSLYSEKVNILGLNFEPKRENLAKAKKYILENQINWKQGVANEEIREKLLVDKYPFYVLVDKNKKILSLGIGLEEVEMFLEEK